MFAQSMMIGMFACMCASSCRSNNSTRVGYSFVAYGFLVQVLARTASTVSANQHSLADLHRVKSKPAEPAQQNLVATLQC